MSTPMYPRVLAELRPYFSLPHPLPTLEHPTSLRAAFAALGPPKLFPSDVYTSSIDIQGVRTLIVSSRTTKSDGLRTLVYVIHPGGFIFGRPEMETPLLSMFAQQGYTCLSPDYRLAPEHPYPAAYDDVYTVWNWLVSPTGGVTQLGVDVNRIILLGTSAGSALASALVFRLASHSTSVMPRLVILDSPQPDSRSAPFLSMSSDWAPAREGYMWWATEGCTDTNRHLFGDDSSAARGEGAPEGAFVNEYDLSRFQALAPHLPPFYLLICELDCLRDSALEFSVKLLAAGVRTDVRVVAGTPHYFTGFFPDTDVAREAKDSYLRAIERALDGY